MNKKGFTLLETLVVIAIISTSLISLYYAYNYSVVNEKIRIHYDDVNYIYKTYYLKESINLKAEDFLMDNKITSVLNDTNLEKTYNVKEMMLLRTDFEILSSCSYDLLDENEMCKNSFSNVSENMLKYVKTLGADVSLNKNDYMFVVIYEEDNLVNYASVRVEASNE